jgi:hypothetical protein
LLLWLGLLVVASVAFSLGFACAVPLAAFGAIAAVTLRVGPAVGLMGAVWLVNQVVGFSLLGYPLTGEAFVWGGILGGVGLLATLAPRVVVGRLAPVAALVVGFGVAFLVYEGGLYVVSATVMGGAEIYTAPVVLRILELNAAAFVGLAVLDRLARGRAVGWLAAPRQA